MGGEGSFSPIINQLDSWLSKTPMTKQAAQISSASTEPKLELNDESQPSEAL